MVNVGEPVRLWRNAGSGTADAAAPMGGWAAIRLRQDGGNRDAIGAMVDVRIGDMDVRRELVVGGGHGGGQLGWMHLGPGPGEPGRDPGDMARRRGRPVARRGVGPVPRGGAGSGGRPAVGPCPAGRVIPVTTARLASIDLPDFGMPDGPSGGSCRHVRAPRGRTAGASRSTRLRPAGGVRRPRAQREPRVPDRLRPALRGGAPRAGSGRPAGDAGGQRVLGHRGAAPLAVRRHLFQDFSLPSQPSDRSRPLDEILAGEGIGLGSRVGVLGWKPYADRSRIEVPAFIVDALRDLTGPAGVVENANDLLIDPGRRAPGDQRRGPARGLRARRLPDVGWHPAPARGPAARHDRSRGGPAAQLERHAPVVPPDAHGRDRGRPSAS